MDLDARGGVQVLNDLIDPAENMTVIAAYDINDSGGLSRSRSTTTFRSSSVWC